MEYLNAERPAAIPTHSTGRSYPVIARFVLPDRSEEWWPSTAVKWTAGHVLVSSEPGEDRVYTWLLASDVKRVIRMPPPDKATNMVDQVVAATPYPDAQ